MYNFDGFLTKYHNIIPVLRVNPVIIAEARFGFEQTMYSGAEGTDVSACVVLRAPTILGKQVILTVPSEDISANGE